MDEDGEEAVPAKERPAGRRRRIATVDDLIRALLEAVPDAMFVVDEQGIIQHANAQAHEMCRWPPGTLNGQSIDVLVPANRRELHAAHRAQFAQAPSTRSMSLGMDLQALRADGSEFPVDVSLSRVVWRGRNLVIAAMRDMSERHRIEQAMRDALHEQAMRDPLTKLFNRRVLDEALELEFARARRKSAPIAMIMADIDRFKRVNDTWGHTCGDRILQCLAQLLQQHMRGGDLVCRYGGEEFVIILPGCSVEAARERVELLRNALRQTTWSTGDCAVDSITLSFGVAAFPLHGATPQQVLHAADVALLRAKAAGRDCVMVSALPSGDDPQPMVRDASDAP